MRLRNGIVQVPRLAEQIAIGAGLVRDGCTGAVYGGLGPRESDPAFPRAASSVCSSVVVFLVESVVGALDLDLDLVVVERQDILFEFRVVD